MDSPALGLGYGGSRASSTVGLVLLDHAGIPIYFNPEAVRILTYPRDRGNVNDLGKSLRDQIQSIFRSRSSVGQTDLTSQFRSGRRHYICRSFPLMRASRNPLSSVTAVLLERAALQTFGVPAAARRFRLTEREHQTVTLLMDGLTSKEIAVRMNVTPNTVKTFVRLIMSKMAVSTRSGIVGKIFAA